MSVELTADAHPADSPTSGVFLSYRREETKHVAGRLADRIGERFTSSQIFVDVDSIPPGVDFTRATQEAIDRSGVLLALIGPRWTTIEDAEGRRRLDDPEDFVVLELRAALDLGIPVIPVLVDGARMPKAAELPPGTEQFSVRNAVRLDAETFRRDVDWLLTQLAQILPAPSSEANEPRPAPRRLLQRRAALRLAGATLAIAAVAAGAWGVSKLPKSDPGAPQAPIDTRIVAVKQQAPSSLGDYLRDTNKSTHDYTPDQLSQTGRVYALTIQLRGERGSKFPLRWFMTDADRAARLRQSGYDQVPVIFRPRTDNHRRTWPVWIPPPPYTGRFRVTFSLENEQHEPVDQKVTPAFGAPEP